MSAAVLDSVKAAANLVNEISSLGQPSSSDSSTGDEYDDRKEKEEEKEEEEEEKDAAAKNEERVPAPQNEDPGEPVNTKEVDWSIPTLFNLITPPAKKREKKKKKLLFDMVFDAERAEGRDREL